MFRTVINIVFVCLMVLIGYHYYAKKKPSAPVPVTVTEAPTNPQQPQTPAGQGNGPEKDLPKMQELLPSAAAPAQLTAPADGNSETYAIMRKAIEKIEQKDCGPAIALLKEIASKEKRALFGIGYCYAIERNHAKVIEYIERYAAVEPNDFYARKMLAIAYHQSDDMKNSLKNAEAALAIQKDDDLPYLISRIKRESSGKKDYINESTNHFKVVFDGYEQGSVNRTVMGLLEDAYRHIGNELRFYPEQPITLILYTTKDFMDTTRAPGWAGGAYDHYDGKIRLPVRGIEGKDPSDLKRLIYHEYTHAVVHMLTSRCPLWINEGLAEYFSTTHKEKIGQRIPLQYLERTFAVGDINAVYTAYVESYSAVSYLIERYGLYRLKNFLQAMGKGTDINQAFKDSFGTTYKDFIATWGK
ncbi:MAG: hypothetical protein EPN22_02095 [Nitrospirae bacterium]|nr:MAG: hypothetical protein EPN22_02095 [Nitrospirota bacterium]